MFYKTVSLSLLLAIALGTSGCGGGTKNGSDSNAPVETLATDKTAPVFAANSVTNKSLKEGGSKEIATYTVTDENRIDFSLQGQDADDFSLIVNIVDSEYKVTLKLKNTPDYEQKESYNVTLVATDKDGNSASKDIVVNIDDQPFAFNVNGIMEPTVAGTTNTLTLETEEAKNDVTYNVIGANFSINGKDLVFTAPPYNEGGKNDYIALVTANDGDSDISLTVRASVIKDANAKPDIKTYLLKSQRDIGDYNTYTLYEYTYDTDNYLISMTKTGTNVNVPETTTFEYSDNHTIMKGYKEPGHKLKSIRVFEKKQTDKNKFAATMKLRLSSDEYTNYISYIPDSVSLQNNMHLTKYIHGLEFGQRKVELYVYNDNDQLSRVLTGSYNKTAEEIAAMTDTQLHTLNAPAGGFPAGDIKLTNAQISSLNGGILPLKVSHETTYVYNTDKKLIARKYFGYAVSKSETDTIIVEYYLNNNAIKEIEIRKKDGSDTIKYNTNTLLESINDYKYNYSQDYSTITIKNGNKTVTTYIFEEE